MKSRAGWRVDAKWIAGIFLTVSLIIFTALFSLYRLTSFEHTRNITEAIVGEPIDQFLDESYLVIRAFAAVNPEQSYESPEGIPFRVELKGRDIANMSQKQLKKYIVDQIATRVYNQGLESIMSEEKQPSEQQQFSIPGLELLQPQNQQSQGLGAFPPGMFVVMGLFTATSHRLFGTLSIISAVFTLIFLGLLIGFSYRFGKAVSPGVCLSLIGLGGVIISSPAKLQAAFLSDAAYSKIIQEPANVVFNTYLTLLIIGIILVIAGLLGGGILRMTYQSKD